MDEKVASPQIDFPASSDSPLSSFSQSPLISPLRNVYLTYCDRRRSLGLSNPGSVEDLSKEVSRSVFLNSHMFSGFRADFTKAFSVKPMFQTAHNFVMGSQTSSPYSFAALYGSSNTFLQANIDNDFTMSARANYRWTSAFVTKSNIQLQPGATAQSMVQLEGEYIGDDFSANLKLANPSILDNAVTGIFVGQYLQSVTPSLALGIEAMWQKASGQEPPQSTLSYCAKYKTPDWIATAQVAPPIGLQLSYWRKLAERVEAGVELNLQFLGLSGAQSMMGQAKNEGTGTFGVKYDFRTSAVRGQVDSTGKVSTCIEKRIAPAVQLTFAGEMDHPKNQARIGLAVSVESAGQDEETQEKMQQATESMPNVPF